IFFILFPFHISSLKNIRYYFGLFIFNLFKYYYPALNKVTISLVKRIVIFSQLVMEDIHSKSFRHCRLLCNRGIKIYSPNKSEDKYRSPVSGAKESTLLDSGNSFAT